MTEEERLLSQLLRERQAGPFVSLEEGERRTAEMIERKREAIDKALADAGEGRVISAEAMNEWIDSWDSENELPIPTAD